LLLSIAVVTTLAAALSRPSPRPSDGTAGRRQSLQLPAQTSVSPVKRGSYERSFRPPAHPGRPRLGRRRAQPPARFTDTFTSRYLQTGGLRQHAAIGGDGPPPLLGHGWPQNWYAWRLVMPTLARDFQAVAPDQRGIGLTDKPQDARYDPGTLADDLVALMDALGQQRFAVVGTDTGLPIGYALAADHPDRIARVALAELPGPPGAATPTCRRYSRPRQLRRSPAADPHRGGLSEKERAAFDDVRRFLQNGGWGCYQMMSARPQAVGYGLTDSPAGLAGWMLVHGGFGNWTYGKDPNQSPTKDEVLDNFSLHWLTNTVTSGARLYWENRDQSLISAAAQKTDEITLPVAITVFPNDDLFRAPETWARRAFPSLSYFHQADRGGHFAAWEEPQLFSEELRAAFRSLR
jgi:pimeloyl-ACP methyl ester carboxylesterase